jgi:peptide/nickel transport system substrate-binding protein
MLKSKGWAFAAGIVLVSLILTACQGQTVRVPVTVVVPQTQPVVQTQIVNVPVTVTPAPTPVNPKTMVVCMGQEPATLAWWKTDLATAHVLEAVYDGGIDNRTYAYQTVWYTRLPSFSNGDAAQVEVTVKDGDPVFDAATSTVVSLTKGTHLNQLDGSSLVYDGSGGAKAVQLWAQWTLVDGMKWEDGTPVTADDEVFHYQVDTSSDIPSVDKSLIAYTAKFEAIDARTAKWTGIPGYTDGTYFLDVWSPLPRHAYGKLQPAQMAQDETINRKPLAFGPFKVDEWVAGDHITLSKNPSYWRAGEGLPKLDKLIFRFVPDTNQLLALLASGRCDLGTQDSPFAGSLPLIKQFEAQKLMTPHVVAGTLFDHLDFNEKPRPGYTGFAAKVKNADGTPIFANPEIRQAIASCIDRQAVVNEAANGAALVQDVYVSSAHPLYGGDANVTKYPFDAAKGLALLAKNGWKDTNGDGILDNGKGQDFSFIYSTRNSTLRQKVTQIIQAQLKTNCMIDTKIQLYGSEFLQTGKDQIVYGANFDMAEFRWSTGAEPPCDLYISDNISRAANNWSGYNILGYSNPAYDAACRAAQDALDLTKKKEEYALAQKIFSADLPSLPLYAEAKIAITSPRVTGVIMDPTENTELWNVENFDFSPK